MGRPTQIKTDNAPAYGSRAFQQFCTYFHIAHTTGIPYNSQGQVIIEQVNRSLKTYIEKQKGGDYVNTPQRQLGLALYTLNFLNCDEQGITPAEEKHRFFPVTTDLVSAKWKDLATGQRQSPDPIITRGRE